MPDSTPWIVVGCSLLGFFVLITAVCTAKTDADVMLDKYDQLLRSSREGRGGPPRRDTVE
jgi:hypothetical protein